MMTSKTGIDSSVETTLSGQTYDKLGASVGGKSWQVRLKIWAGGKVQAWWFPWFLSMVNFLDYFCLIGFVVPIFQGVAFVQVRASRAAMICFLCASGGFLGSWCLVIAIDHFQLLGGQIDQHKFETAAKLVKDWGPLGGLINGVSPLPNIPLLLAATALESNRLRVLLTLFLMAVGRFLKYVAMAVTLRAGKAAASAAFKSSEPGMEMPTLPSAGTTIDDASSGRRIRPTHRTGDREPPQ